ncbi:unnamed protein product [Adineta steineri]|uniref:Uncharacterized protein n=1 Tax=Adineta steineri TaxID=433720 RepID=A0A818U4X6_9BILA|nr:unnamed protein product [Adineta steineri]
MSTDKYKLLTTVKTLDDAIEIIMQHGLSKYRSSNLAHYTKYSYSFYTHDNDPTTIKLTYKNTHYHDQRNVTNRLPSPVRVESSQNIQEILKTTTHESSLSQWLYNSLNNINLVQ